MAAWLWILLLSLVGLAVGFRLFSRARVSARDDEEGQAAARAPLAAPAAPRAVEALPRVDYEEDEEVDPTKIAPLSQSGPPAKSGPVSIVYDQDAIEDEPTGSRPLVLVTATAQTDQGVRRKRNEDSVLMLEEEHVYIVADGMGGNRGGEVASAIAVETIERTFAARAWKTTATSDLPRRASELAQAIQAANDAILDCARKERELEGMGTTICAARFSLKKQRLYLGHVGDSRGYRLRDGQLRQMTSDHTIKGLGVTGHSSGHLSRAVGVWPELAVDIILGKPAPGDYYLLCSDGLTKMVDDATIERILSSRTEPSAMVEKLVQTANASGGLDNVSVIVMRVDEPPISPIAEGPQPS